MKKIVLLACGSLLLTSCYRDCVAFRHTIIVRVADRENEPIHGANVYLYSKNGSTLTPVAERENVDGCCEFPNLEQIGDYLVRVKCEPHFRDGEGSIKLDNDAKDTVDVFLMPFL